MAEFKPQPVSDPLPQPAGRAAKTGMVTKPVSFDMQPDESGFIVEQSSGFKGFYQNNKWYFWAIILGIVIIGTLAFFAFRSQEASPTENADVILAIDAADTASAGGEMIYKIQVDNRDKASLQDIKLELIYDDGIKYVSSVPPSEGSNGSRFPVPDLGNSENAVLMIKTQVSGNINDDKRLVARLHYKFENFNSEFTEESSHTVRLTAADIVLDMTGPKKVNNVQNASYDVYYRNDSDKSIKGARIQVTYPQEFKFESSTPSASLGQNIWNLSNLDRNASGKISFSGNFKGVRPGQAVMFKIEFLALDDSNSYFTQSSTTYMTEIDAQPLGADLRLVNDNPSGIVKPGDSLQYEVKFQNNTAVTATGLNVVVDLDSKAIDMAQVRAEGGLIEGNSITWNAASVPKLERVNPNESGTFQFTVQLKNPAVKDNSENVTVVAKARVKSNENQVFLYGNDVSLKISSPSNIEKSVSVVSGPTPPKVGSTTTLQVSVALRNSSNDYREGVFVGYIPLGVSLDKASITSSEAAAVKFDSATGKLTWTVGQLSAHSGSTSPLRTLKFNVNITPSGTQVGQAIPLLKTISFNAKDTFTEQNISLTSQEVSTDNLSGEGKGRVVAQ